MTRERGEHITDGARLQLTKASLEVIKDVILATFDSIEEPAGIDWAEFEKRCRERLMRRTQQ